MTLGSLLDQARELYLAHLVDAITTVNPVAIEPALRTADGAVATEGLLDLPVRVDLVHPGSRESLRIDSERCLRFQPFTFAWQDRLTVEIRDLTWDWIVCRVSAPPGWNTAPLKRWFLDGFDPPGPSTAPAGLLGALHFMSDPAPDDGGFLFKADLGSAPVEAFEQLLDAIRATGATSVVIGGGAAS